MVLAVLARNEGAEKHICEMLKLAKAMNAERLQIAGSEGCTTQTALAAGPDAVDVLPRGPGTEQYQLTRPHEQYAACTCKMAQQRMICHHQVAFLLASSLDQRAAERAIYRLLGLRFGFLGGCSEEDIGLLWQELIEQPPSSLADAAHQSGTAGRDAQATGTAPPRACSEMSAPAATAAAAEVDEHAPAGSAGPAATAEPGTVVAAPSAQPPGMGQQAFESAVNAAIGIITAAAERAMAAEGPQSRELFAGMLTTVAAQVNRAADDAVSGRVQPGADFAGATFVGSLKRKKGCLERSKNKRPRAAAAAIAAAPDGSAASAPGAAPAQKEFAHRSQLPGAVEKLQVSKAWAHGRSAKQAAEHVQACLNVQAAQKAAATNVCKQPRKAAKEPDAGTPDVPSVPTRSQPRRSAAPVLGKYSALADGGDDDHLPDDEM